MSNKMRCALIGCGRISAKHIEVCNRLDDIDLVGICDKKADRLAAAAKKSGARPFSDHLDMLKTVKPDMAVVLAESGALLAFVNDPGIVCPRLADEEAD